MKFSLPKVATDAGPKPYQKVMPPNTAASKTASQGSKGSPSGHGPNGTTKGPAGKSPVNFSGSPAKCSPKDLPKPLYDMPKHR